MFHDLPFMMYVLEQEGELDTPLGKRNKLIKDLRELGTWELIDETVVRREAIAAGFEILTDQEVEEILREVNMG